MSAAAVVLHLVLEEQPLGVVVAMRASEACRAGAWAEHVREAAHRELDAAIDRARADCEASEHGCTCMARAA